MKEMIDDFTWRAIQDHDDGAAIEYYRRLRETRRLHTTRCTSCGRTSYPPRPFCPTCFGESIEWVEIGSEATLYAFTTQQRALRFVQPDVIGIVEIAGVGRILSRINAPLESLRIGQKLRFEPLELSADLVVHSFTPVT